MSSLLKSAFIIGILMRSGHYTNETGYRTFIPAILPPNPPLQIDAEIEALNIKAMKAAAAVDTFWRISPNRHLFQSMFLKREALLSSQIEGVQASLLDVLTFEQGAMVKNKADIEEVINCLNALNYGVKRLNDLPISLRLIKEVHAELMRGVRGSSKTPGEFRRSQNWIGRAWSTPETATFVPPAVHHMMDALNQLESYLHNPSKHPLIDSALIHYQFETIHPFLDGNGRVGRLLIPLYLLAQNEIRYPSLCMSSYLKEHRAEYYRLLSVTREKGDYEQWVTFFLKGILVAAENDLKDLAQVLELRETDRKSVEMKVPSQYALSLLDQLFVTPLINIHDIAKKFEVSFQTASTLVSGFEAAGILKEVTGRKRDRRFAYTKYLAILEKGTEPL